MSTPLHVLILEDRAADAELMLRELRRAGFAPDWQRAETEADYRVHLRPELDVILADYSLPQFDALGALRVLQDSGFDVPFIVVTGTVGEESAVECMKLGAADYLLKDRLTRLGPAVARALQEKQLRDEKRQAEAALRRAQKLESLGVLAGGIAHDFNNLLVAMLGQTSLALAKLPLESSARNHVEKAVKAAERAADLTRQMLAYSGRGQFEIRLVNLNALIRENLHLFEVAVPKNVQLRAQPAEALPLIEADAGQMQQVIMNLIINAAEAIGERPGVVTVITGARTLHEDDSQQWQYTSEPLPPGRYVTLEVRDNGSGMDAETLSRIFDPFFTTKFTGRGLGLAAVLGIVRGHHGGLRVDSEVGRGTTFRLAFPAASTEDGTLQARAEGEISASVLSPQPPALILVIDDEQPVREAVTDILEVEGLRVLTAPNGAAGVALYRAHQTDIRLVLLDLSMPGMSGEETLRALRQINPVARVIVSSGYSEAEALQHFTGQELTGFIQKPYDAAKLIGEIRRQLR
jgi:signal transduction histidine kinase